MLKIKSEQENIDFVEELKSLNGQIVRIVQTIAIDYSIIGFEGKLRVVGKNLSVSKGDRQCLIKLNKCKFRQKVNNAIELTMFNGKVSITIDPNL